VQTRQHQAAADQNKSGNAAGAHAAQQAPSRGLGGLSLRRGVAWTFVGNAVYAASQWAVLVVIAKTTTPAALGQFALGLAITAPIIIFANQGLRDLQATDAHQQCRFVHYLRYRLLSVAFALALIALLTRVFSYPPVVIIVGVSKALESIIDLVYGRYQQHERVDWMATSMMVRGVLSVVAVAVLLTATHTIVWGAAGLIVANAAVLVLYDWRPQWLFRSDEASSSSAGAPAESGFRTGTGRRLLMLGLPLGLAQMLNSFSIGIPRYFLERYAGEASLGIFAAIMYLIVASRTVIVAVALSCVARLAKYFAYGDRKAFNSLLQKQLLLGLAFGVAGIAFSLIWGPEFLRLVYKPEYADHHGVLLLAMLIAFIGHPTEFAVTALTAVRSIKVQPFILGVCVAVGWAGSAVLIPRYGIMGASWVVLLITATQFLLYVSALAYALRADSRQRGGATPVSPTESLS
jgi:O-antigen/teichoic acid export membrane protein